MVYQVALVKLWKSPSFASFFKWKRANLNSEKTALE